MASIAEPTSIAAPQVLAPMAGALTSNTAPSTAAQMITPTPQAAPPVAAALQPPLTPTLTTAPPAQATAAPKSIGGSCAPLNAARQPQIATPLETPTAAPQVLTPISTLPTS